MGDMSVWEGGKDSGDGWMGVGDGGWMGVGDGGWGTEDGRCRVERWAMGDGRWECWGEGGGGFSRGAGSRFNGDERVFWYLGGLGGGLRQGLG